MCYLIAYCHTSSYMCKIDIVIMREKRRSVAFSQFSQISCIS